MTPTSRRAEGALLLISLLWGTTFVLVKAGLGDASPFIFLALRFGVAAAAAALLFGIGSPGRPDFRRGLVLGLAMGTAYACQTIGLLTTTPARSAFLTAMNVALVPLWAAWLLGSRPHRGAIVGLALTLVGVYLLTSPEAGSWKVGDSWTLACAVLFALHVALLSRWAGRGADGSLLVTQLGAVALGAAVFVPFEGPQVRWTGALVVAVLATALLATVATTWLQLRFQPRVEPTRVAILYATEPAFAAAFSWLVGGETLTRAALLGGLLIVCGALVADRGGSPRHA